ncbi:hypothetical protein D8B34_26745 [Verminephrobacter eiseniae]|nr:hypothetical protein [Verminephrobacter eiseniae]MCW8188042.1 hypothetical protein [Verminephrobacter eiseniae]MCW8226085.1 hypothetical protein [Verminephrobacter eiseniae]MCW8237153.1 hypothetical protein [Verminephrobacter eiseniae]
MYLYGLISDWLMQRIAAVLQADQINLVRMVLVQVGVVKHNVAIGIGFHLIGIVLEHVHDL